MFKIFLAAVAISLAFSSFPALAQQKSCEEFCRTKKCTSQGMGTVNACMSKCVPACNVKRSGGK